MSTAKLGLLVLGALPALTTSLVAGPTGPGAIMPVAVVPAVAAPGVIAASSCSLPACSKQLPSYVKSDLNKTGIADNQLGELEGPDHLVWAPPSGPPAPVSLQPGSAGYNAAVQAYDKEYEVYDIERDEYWASLSPGQFVWSGGVSDSIGNALLMSLNGETTNALSPGNNTIITKNEPVRCAGKGCYEYSHPVQVDVCWDPYLSAKTCLARDIWEYEHWLPAEYGVISSEIAAQTQIFEIEGDKTASKDAISMWGPLRAPMRTLIGLWAVIAPYAARLAAGATMQTPRYCTPKLMVGWSGWCAPPPKRPPGAPPLSGPVTS
ncbi:MAG TPA: hypothetical protein VMD59_08845 [Acidimicrobiales bacterium]|nr:hypothetical protein [Acidimicrobiales bacterium]